MTTTIKIHVNGRYETTVEQSVEGEASPREPVVIGPQEEKQLYFVHGKENSFKITEKYLGEALSQSELAKKAAETQSESS